MKSKLTLVQKNSDTDICIIGLISLGTFLCTWRSESSLWNMLHQILRYLWDAACKKENRICMGLNLDSILFHLECYLNSAPCSKASSPATPIAGLLIQTLRNASPS